VAEFEINRRGFREFLLSGQLYPALEAHAATVRARAESLAGSHVRTGKYLSSFSTERGRSASRVHVRVVNSDDAAAPIEAQQHILGRAAG
jgi:hypothetical protein